MVTLLAIIADICCHANQVHLSSEMIRCFVSFLYGLLLGNGIDEGPCGVGLVVRLGL